MLIRTTVFVDPFEEADKKVGNQKSMHLTDDKN